MRHYGIPEKITNIVRNSYEGMSCRVVHGKDLTDSFQVRTGVRQGCLLSPFLFLLALDWIMSTSTANRKNGIQWTPWKYLEDLDYADDVALLSHNQHQMQEKTTIISQTSTRIGLDIHPTKSQILKVNTENTTPIVLGDRPLEEVDAFTYLGSNVDKQGGTDADIRIRIGKARAAFHQLRSIWKATILSTKTKLRIFNSIVKPVLLYGAETWRTTVANTKKLQTFLNTCLRKILKINWPDIISNQELCGEQINSR